MMRVSAVLKRTAANVPAASDGERVTIGDMVVDFAARQVTIKGEKLNLSPRSTTCCSTWCATAALP